MGERDKTLTIRLSERDLEAMDTLAKKYGESRSELIRKLVISELLYGAYSYEFMSVKSSTDQIDEAIDSIKSGAVD